VEQVRRCLEADPGLHVLGDGANLLVDDRGVEELVIALNRGELGATRIDRSTGTVHAGAGADLPRLVVETVRSGLGGLENLGGIPATVGGAVIMNAGGTFGQIADCVERVHALSRDGHEVVLARSQIGFSYRHSGLNGLVLTSVEFALSPGDPAALRARLLEIMRYKKDSQPMSARSAGCVFKNPTLLSDLRVPPSSVATGRPDAFAAGQRVSAGMLIDRSGCKGLGVGGASVSERHANFIVTAPGARARDVIDLMRMVASRVFDAFGVRLEPEVIIWSRAQ
jgi:UDP-N-acetylmuramate dehydrogenase